jgi:hypothetical protein
MSLDYRYSQGVRRIRCSGTYIQRMAIEIGMRRDRCDL